MYHTYMIDFVNKVIFPKCVFLKSKVIRSDNMILSEIKQNDSKLVRMILRWHVLMMIFGY